MARLVRFLSLFVLLAATLLVGAGCGYRSALPGGPADLTRSGATVSRPIRMAVLAIRNDSPEPWLDRIVGDAMRREMELRGGFELEADPSQAEWVLRGRIRPLSTLSNSFSSFVAALEYAVTMQLDLEVVRAGGTVVRLDPVSLSETELYLASEDIEVTRTNRLEALRHLSDVLASRVADSIELLERPIGSEAPASPAGGSEATDAAVEGPRVGG